MKCKKNFKKKFLICIPTKKALDKAPKKSLKIIKLTLIGTLFSMGGWAVFTALIKLFNLDNFNPWLLGISGLLIVLITTLLGWNKLK
jgi:hypothetical protein